MAENETQQKLFLPTASNNPSHLPLYYILLASFIAFTAVVGNGIVIYVIWTRRQLHVVTNYFVVSLAAADFLVGLFLPTFLIICHYWSVCKITTFYMFFNMFTLVSIANLFVMTIDRYISIVLPLRYPASHVTLRRISGAILVSWILPGLLSFSPLFWMSASSEEVKDAASKAHAFVVITAFEVVPTVVMPAMYAHILITARRHARLLAVQRTQLEFNNASHGDYHQKSVLDVPAAAGKRNSDSSQRSTERRKSSDGSSIAVLGSVIGFFVLCWSFDIVISFCHKLELCIIGDGLFRTSDLMIFLNSAVNPLVYALLKKDIRRELSSLYSCCMNTRVIET